MSVIELPIAPLRFGPIVHPRIWGGTRLRGLLGKPVAGATPIGESWELSALPDNESRLLGGSQDGRTLPELAGAFANDLIGDVADREHEFPLLIKFLDAEQPLSVQVHPKPLVEPAAEKVAVKHEAWYIVHADPGAELYIGLKPGVTPDDIARAANSPVMRDLLMTRPARTGDCFYLPSGTLHALGAGLLVAEVQTPSDVTYRIYDWDRVDAEGQPRELHVEAALANIRYDVAESEIAQKRVRIPAEGVRCERLCKCPRFSIDALTPESESFPWPFPQHTFAVWMIVSGSAILSGDAFSTHVTTGDTVLMPAALEQMRVTPTSDFEALHILPAEKHEP